jgi:hypothetical protein
LKLDVDFSKKWNAVLNSLTSPGPGNCTGARAGSSANAFLGCSPLRINSILIIGDVFSFLGKKIKILFAHWKTSIDQSVLNFSYVHR